MKQILFVTTSIVFLLAVKPVFAASSATVTATIRVNVCGDGIVGGEEECDNTDLNSKNCTDYGYKSGALTCDPSCSFDFVSCSIINTSSNDEDDDSNDNSNSDNSPDETNVPTEAARPTSYTRVFAVPELPAVLKGFDVDGNNKIELAEITSSAKKWYSSWKESLASGSAVGAECDINEDKTCDVSDFSVLMYHISR